jgi:hypothetical protein
MDVKPRMGTLPQTSICEIEVCAVYRFVHGQADDEVDGVPLDGSAASFSSKSFSAVQIFLLFYHKKNICTALFPFIGVRITLSYGIC